MTAAGIAIIKAAGHSAATTLRREVSITAWSTPTRGTPTITPVNKAVPRGLLVPEQIALPALGGLRIDVVADRGCAVRGTLPASPNPWDARRLVE